MNARRFFLGSAAVTLASAALPAVAQSNNVGSAAVTVFKELSNGLLDVGIVVTDIVDVTADPLGQGVDFALDGGGSVLIKIGEAVKKAAKPTGGGVTLVLKRGAKVFKVTFQEVKGVINN